MQVIEHQREHIETLKQDVFSLKALVTANAFTAFATGPLLCPPHPAPAEGREHFVSPPNMPSLPISAEAIRSIDQQPEQRLANQNGEASPQEGPGGQQAGAPCAIPNPPLSGKLGTVKTIWAEWTIGWHGEDGRLNPSIQQLNREYGSSWRKKKHNGNPTGYKKNEYNRKKKVAAAILTLKEQHMAAGLPEAEATEKAVNDVEESFKRSGSTHFSRWVDHVLRVKPLDPAAGGVAGAAPAASQAIPAPAAMQAILSQLTSMPLPQTSPISGVVPPASLALPPPEHQNGGILPMQLPVLPLGVQDFQQMLPGMGLGALGAGFPTDPMTFQQLLQGSGALAGMANPAEAQPPNGAAVPEDTKAAVPVVTPAQ